MKRTSCQQSVIRNQKLLCRKDNSSFLSHLSSLERKQSFTLIELLIVIAIIAILAGMLLPALKSARDQAYTAACINRQKQFGTAFMLYADSYKEWSIGNSYPAYLPRVNTTTKKNAWNTLFQQNHPNASGVTLFKHNPSKGLIKNYMKVIVCPTAYASGRMTKSEIPDGSYAINDHLSEKQNRRSSDNWVSQGKVDNSNTYASFFKPATVPHPSNLHWARCTRDYKDVSFEFWHGQTAPMLFVDLAVRKLKRSNIAPYNGVYRIIWSYYPCSGNAAKIIY